MPKLTNSATGLLNALSWGIMEAFKAADSCVRSSKRLVNFLSQSSAPRNYESERRHPLGQNLGTFTLVQ